MSNESLATYDRHVAAVAAHDVEAVLATYHPDAVKIGPEGSGQGRGYLRAVFEAAPATILDDLDPQVSTTAVGDVVFVEWRSGEGARTPSGGADTFVFADGLIIAHTEVRTAALEPRR